MKAGSSSYTIESFRAEPALSDSGFLLVVSGWFHSDSTVQAMQLELSNAEKVTHDILDFTLPSPDVARYLGEAATNVRFELKIPSANLPLSPNAAVINIFQTSGDIYSIDITKIFEPHQAIADIKTRELVMRFESLGDNCELGLLQRAMGAERLGLFRYAGTFSTSALIRGIECSFAGFATKDDLQFHTDHDEWIGVSHKYGYVFHTRRFQTSITEEQIREEESARLSFLARLLVDEVQEGEKIFVRRIGGLDGTPSEQGMHELYRALRALGPAKLIWVTPGTQTHQAPKIVHLGEGLYRGYIGRIAPYEDAHDFSAPDWISLLSLATDMIGEAETDAVAIRDKNFSIVGKS